MKPPRAIFAAAAALTVAVGCDVPTEPPIVEQRWVVPVDETTLSVDELLPGAVSTVGDAFDISIDPVTASATLGDLCPECTLVDGMEAPVPPFEEDFVQTQALPAEVTSAEVSGGSIDLSIHNGFSFDPLENGGTMVVTIADDLSGDVLGEVALDGTTETLDANSTVFRTIELSSATVTGPLRATVAVDAPGGQMAEIDVSDIIEVTADVTSFLVSSVTVDVGNRTVSFEDQEIDLEGIDENVTDRIVAGSIILDVANPFSVSVDGSIEIGGTSKSFSIAESGPSAVTLDYTGDELRSFIGQPNVFFSGSGTAEGTSVTIQPGQEMELDATLDVTLEIG